MISSHLSIQPAIHKYILPMELGGRADIFSLSSYTVYEMNTKCLSYERRKALTKANETFHKNITIGFYSTITIKTFNFLDNYYVMTNWFTKINNKNLLVTSISDECNY